MQLDRAILTLTRISVQWMFWGVFTPSAAYKCWQGKLLHENMQPGSGSTDFMMTAAYTIRRGAWGFTADVLGRLNTTDHHDYHFGNRVSGFVKAFYWKNLSKFSNQTATTLAVQYSSSIFNFNLLYHANQISSFRSPVPPNCSGL